MLLYSDIYKRWEPTPLCKDITLKTIVTSSSQKLIVRFPPVLIEYPLRSIRGLTSIADTRIYSKPFSEDGYGIYLAEFSSVGYLTRTRHDILEPSTPTTLTPRSGVQSTYVLH